DCDDADCAGFRACEVAAICDPLARPIGLGEVQTGVSEGAGRFEGSCGGGGESAEIVFAFTLEASTLACLSTAGSRFDTVLYVRAGDCTDAAAEIACNDESMRAPGGASEIEGRFDAGVTYYVFLDRFDDGQNAPADFRLDLLEGPCGQGPPCEVDAQCDGRCGPAGRCVGCLADADCAVGRCDPGGRCAACLADADCAEGDTCADGSCTRDGVPDCVEACQVVLDCFDPGAPPEACEAGCRAESTPEDRLCVTSAPSCEAVSACFEPADRCDGVVCDDGLVCTPATGLCEDPLAPTCEEACAALSACGFVPEASVPACIDGCRNDSIAAQRACVVAAGCDEAAIEACSAPPCGGQLCQAGQACFAEVCRDLQPVHDCADPAPLAVGRFYGTTADAASAQAGSCGGQASPEAVYVLDAPAGDYCLRTTGSQIDSVLYVRRVCDAPDSELACNDDSPLAGGLASALTVAGGAPLYVFVDALGGGGPYALIVTEGACAP
ncbi:MAG: hypothetical protein KC549_00095, partial [Myxococcales bacterium]|nr:hypothetical protein [Myxococcales bacterium]